MDEEHKSQKQPLGDDMLEPLRRLGSSNLGQPSLRRADEIIAGLNARIEEQKKAINRLLAHVKHHCPEQRQGIQDLFTRCDFVEPADGE